MIFTTGRGETGNPLHWFKWCSSRTLSFKAPSGSLHIGKRFGFKEAHRALIGHAEPHQARNSGDVIGVGYR